MEIIKTFGLNPLLLLAQIVNFLILFYILKRFLYKPVLKLLQEREERIQKGISDSQKAAKALAEAQIHEQKILKDASGEAEKIMGEGRREIEELQQEFENRLKTDREQMLTDAKQDIANQRTRMEKELMGNTTQAAITIVEKVLTTALASEDRKKLLDRANRELTKQVVS